jgi:hypothetical protein
MLRLSALGLRRDPLGYVKQIHHEELENSDKERPSTFPKIMLKQTDSGIQQLHRAGERPAITAPTSSGWPISPRESRPCCISVSWTRPSR